MKKYRLMIAALVLGLLSSLLSYLRYVNLGDFDHRGFPIPFLRGVWGMGMSHSFSIVALIADIIIWSFVWFVVIKLSLMIRRK